MSCARDHTIAVDRTGHYRAVPGALKLWLATSPNSDTVIAVVPTEWTAGLSFVAASRESVRRVPKEHGIFAWCIQYRVDERGQARDGVLRVDRDHGPRADAQTALAP